MVFIGSKAKKNPHVSGQTVSPKLTRARGFFFLFFFFFLLVRFINRGKRSEMVSVGMKGTRYELNISIYPIFYLSSYPIFLGNTNVIHVV